MTSPAEPQSPGDLRPWLIGGGNLVEGLSSACEAMVLCPWDWRRLEPAERPALLVVEGTSGCVLEWGEDLDRLLSHCKSAAIPRLLWLSASPIGEYWLARLSSFDRVFSTDRSHRLELEALGVEMPATLWPATTLPIETSHREGSGLERAHPVVWHGGWRTDWPAAWRERLTSVLRGAAECGLRILGASDLDDLPGDLRPLVGEAVGVAPEEVLRRARVAIASDPELGSPTACPATALDAAACGAAVITPHVFSSDLHFGIAELRRGRPRQLIQPVQDGADAKAEIERLLADERLRTEVTTHTSRILTFNHTYSHRVATLASAVGYRLLPDAGLPAPA